MRGAVLRAGVAAGLAASCAGACGESTIKPTDAPAILCPVAVSQPSADGQPVTMTYPAAMVSGGATPVTTKCMPPSPSMFPLGTTSVTCTATDARNRTASCSFPVVVTAPPRIAATRFIAFGDSMSDGVLGVLAPQTLGDPGPPVGYAYKLRTLLASRYTAQTISMTDEGRANENVTMGSARLPGVLAADQPEVVLLLEGVNDLNGGHDAAIPTVKRGLTDMVRTARARGVTVFLATLLPQRPDAPRAYAPASIVPANVEIRNVANAEGAVLVDLYAAFDGQTSTLIGPDGLHPTESGYQKMAEVFFAGISGRLELKPSNLQFGIRSLESAHGSGSADSKAQIPISSARPRAR